MPKHLPAAAAVALALSLGAHMPAQALTAQQEKMKTCNTEASTEKLKGTARKAFMSTCLKNDAETARRTLTAQQEKMKTCSEEAKTKALKGKARTSFMSTCLKG